MSQRNGIVKYRQCVRFLSITFVLYYSCVVRTLIGEREQANLVITAGMILRRNCLCVRVLYCMESQRNALHCCDNASAAGVLIWCYGAA